MIHRHVKQLLLRITWRT